MILFRFKDNEFEKEFNFGSWLHDDDNDADSPINALQTCLEEIAEPQLGSNFELEVYNVIITRPVLVLLMQLLNQPFNDAIEPWIQICDKPISDFFAEPTPPVGKWDLVKFVECRLALANTAVPTLDDGLDCAPVDIHTFAWTVSRRTMHLSLVLNDWPDILHALGDLPELHIGVWSIVKFVFTPLDCEQLADSLLGNQSALKTVNLTSRHIEDPLVLQYGLENVVSLVIRSYDGSFSDDRWHSATFPYLCRTLIGEDGNGVLPRLLQSPYSDLKSLNFQWLPLEDQDIIAIVETLRQSQLEALTICGSSVCCGLDGIMALADQLPSITCLKKVELNIAWEDVPDEDVLDEPYMALMLGMKYNYSIETICVTAKNDDYAVHKRLTYYADLNRAGRRFSFPPKNVPAGLWPWILERAGTKCFPTESRRADAIYFLLQHSPVISGMD